MSEDKLNSEDYQAVREAAIKYYADPVYRQLRTTDTGFVDGFIHGILYTKQTYCTTQDAPKNNQDPRPKKKMYAYFRHMKDQPFGVIYEICFLEHDKGCTSSKYNYVRAPTLDCEISDD